VHIGVGSWLGAGAVILPGTSLGRNTVVGAGAVVRGSFPDHAVLAGTPDRIVRRYEAGSGWHQALRDVLIDAPPGWPAAGG
jgi:acetyltransferase-like isoleucine patch superfamily enzyme